MTPQAGLPPAFPVFLLSACPPFPRSSVPAWTTIVLPRTECSPINLMCWSVTDPLAFPWPSVLKFPRSPTCLSESSGAPCSFPNGLTLSDQCWFLQYLSYSQWGPAEVQPFVLSPNWWTCIPLSALASWPEISHEMLVGDDSDDCSKVTVPLMFESPRRTATVLY